MIIYLIGYMGSGKTTVGKQLAEKMNFRFIDLDHLFEEKYKITVSSFFEKYDEEIFRNIESALIKEVSEMDNVIVSTGGGAPCFFNNMEIMKKSGIVVYLKMAVSSLINRLINAKNVRPLIKSKSEEELLSFITNHLKEREQFYNQAQLTVKGESCDVETLSKLIQAYQ